MLDPLVNSIPSSDRLRRTMMSVAVGAACETIGMLWRREQHLKAYIAASSRSK